MVYPDMLCGVIEWIDAMCAFASQIVFDVGS